ncbi:hypothetical protein [Celeribacter litoreus]|uniref:hypothetical protein n=1 Tax=Celeribacter litoreus TaxID=2876714 RepID=UPI001CC996D5|nr:hypothetical protein [Celeribacter litoreus]MCA0044675.1 hypothetical protein [Celeribacter litoreus]
MPTYAIQSPSDETLYPFRLIQFLIQDGAPVEKGQPFAVLEVDGGRIVRQAAPISGIIRHTVAVGATFNSRAEITRIEEVEAPKTPPKQQSKAKPANAPLWSAHFTPKQIDRIEDAYRAAFGAAADGPADLHPADRLVAAGVSFHGIMAFEKLAMEEVRKGQATRSETLVRDAAIIRERERVDGYYPNTFVLGSGEQKLFLIPAFIKPIIDKISLNVGVLKALEVGAGHRPQSIEDAWDYMLPDIAELRRICAETPPNFALNDYKAAGDFGRQELARVLRDGFSDTGRPSAALWTLYTPTIKGWLKSAPPATRPVDMHPVDYMAKSERPFSSGRSEAVLRKFEGTLARSKNESERLLYDYLAKAYDKQLETGHTTKPFLFWKKYGLALTVVPLIVIASFVITITLVSPHTSDRMGRDIVNGAKDITRAVAKPVIWVAGGIGGLFGSSSNDGGATVTTASTTTWTEQTAPSYAPSSLASLDNGNRPTRSAAEQANFQAWLEN